MSQEVDGNPLTPALARLLRTALATVDLTDAGLARSLFLAESTINTEFKRVFALTGARSRFEAIQIALEKGWIDPRPGSSLIRIAPESMAPD